MLDALMPDETNTHLNFYQKNGFLILKDFLSKSECHSLLNRTKELIRGFDTSAAKTLFSTATKTHAETDYFLESGNKIHFFFEPDAFDERGQLAHDIFLSVNKIGHALHEKDPVFSAFSHSAKIKKLANTLNIHDPVLLQSMIVCKQAYVGGEVTCHQDSTFLHTEKNSLLGLWFALEDATIENSCLWVIPGGHHTPLKSRMIRKENQIYFDNYNEEKWELEKMVPIPVTRGSVIVLHGHLPHMSKANYSDKSRHAYTLHLMSDEDTFSENNWLRR